MAPSSKRRSAASDKGEESAATTAKRARHVTEEQGTPQPQTQRDASPVNASPKRGRNSTVNSSIVWIRRPIEAPLQPVKDIPWITKQVTDIFKEVEVRAASCES